MADGSLYDKRATAPTSRKGTDWTLTQLAAGSEDGKPATIEMVIGSDLDDITNTTNSLVTMNPLRGDIVMANSTHTKAYDMQSAQYRNDLNAGMLSCATSGQYFTTADVTGTKTQMTIDLAFKANVSSTSSAIQQIFLALDPTGTDADQGIRPLLQVTVASGTTIAINSFVATTYGSTVNVKDAATMVVGKFYEIVDMGDTTNANWISLGATTGCAAGHRFQALLTTLGGATTGTIKEYIPTTAHSFTFTPNATYHIAATYYETSSILTAVNIYLNSVLVYNGNVTPTDLAASAQYFWTRVLAKVVSKLHYQAKWLRYKFNNYALTSDEVKVMFNNGMPHTAINPFLLTWGSNTDKITNGDCEADVPKIGTTAFTLAQGSWARSTEQKVSGSYSMKYTSVGGTNSRIFSSVALTAGKKYLITCYVYVPSANTVMTQIDVKCGVAVVTTLGTATDNDTWTRISGVVTASDGYFIIGSRSSTTNTETFYVDDISFIELGVVNDLAPENAVVTAGTGVVTSWIDASNNGLNATPTGNPTMIFEQFTDRQGQGILDSVMIKTTKATVTGNSTWTALIPAGWRVDDITAEATIAPSGAVTFNVGTASSGDTNIVNGYATPTGLSVSTMTLLRKAFSMTASTTVYIQSADWKSGTFSFYITLRRI
jgi:hypothetical protein